MGSLIKNGSNEIPECSTENLSLIENRIEEEIDSPGVGLIRAEVFEFHEAISNSSNAKIRNIKKAVTFPVKDVFKMLAEHEDCKYLRIYNGFNSAGEYVAYMAPISNALETYSLVSPARTTISRSCCHCNPCSTDKILNP